MDLRPLPTRLRLFRWKPTPYGSSSLVLFYLTHAVAGVLVIADICPALVDVTKRVGLRTHIRQPGTCAQNFCLFSHLCVAQNGVGPRTCLSGAIGRTTTQMCIRDRS